MKTTVKLFLLFSFFGTYPLKAQDSIKSVKSTSLPTIKPMKFALNTDGSHFVQFTGVVQVWARYTELNF
jgi:hypothetical protein